MKKAFGNNPFNAHKISHKIRYINHRNILLAKMKISAALFLASLASASAFVVPSARPIYSGLRMSETSTPTEEASMLSEEAPAEPIIEEPTGPLMSKSMPFMEVSPALDGSMAGDVGFDPLGFAKTKEDLINYREAEVKHARLAMLAAAGWPISELADKKLATLTGLTPLVDAADRAPSVLNGGLGKVSPVYWLACLVGAAAIDFIGMNKSKSDPEYFPGNFGFDPLGVYPKEKEGQMWMQTAEIKNGRLAMIAITAFAVQEFVSKVGVVDETPVFFKPLTTVISEYTNSGYIIH